MTVLRALTLFIAFTLQGCSLELTFVAPSSSHDDATNFPEAHYTSFQFGNETRNSIASRISQVFSFTDIDRDIINETVDTNIRSRRDYFGLPCNSEEIGSDCAETEEKLSMYALATPLTAGAITKSCYEILGHAPDSPYQRYGDSDPNQIPLDPLMCFHIPNTLIFGQSVEIYRCIDFVNDSGCSTVYGNFLFNQNLENPELTMTPDFHHFVTNCGDIPDPEGPKRRIQAAFRHMTGSLPSTIPEPNEENISQAFELFYDMPASREVIQSFMTLKTEGVAQGLNTEEIWRYNFLVLCTSPGWHL